jgi:uncharacterized RDD family membrane protein YckC
MASKYVGGVMHDPKTIVTPYAFKVSENLLGLSLATPKRRMAAFLVDLIIVGLLSALGKLVLALLITVLFIRIQMREREEQKNKRRWIWSGLVGLAILSISIVIISGEENSSDYSTAADSTAAINWEDFLNKAIAIDYDDAEEAEQRWEELGQELENKILGLDKEEEEPSTLPPELPALLQNFSAAVQKEDHSATDSLKTELEEILAGPKLAHLRDQRTVLMEKVKKLSDENSKLSKRVKNPDTAAMLKAAVGDFGFAMGWTGLYFTIMLVWLKGQTPGKKLLGLKVVRLNNKPLSLWNAFERTGGYAAGMATGLLGFLQVYWDANRQGIHDKIAGTVVVKLKK